MQERRREGDERKACHWDGYDPSPRVDVKAASIVRANDAGKDTYTTVLKVAIGLLEAKTSDFTLRLTHTPGSDPNETYSGVLSILFDDAGRLGEARTSSFSLLYDRSLETSSGVATQRVKYDLRSGSYAEGKQAFTDDGLLEFNTGSCGNAADAQAPMRFVSYDGYPELDVGKLASWTNFGSSYDEATRSFVFVVRRENGCAVGCAVTGSAGYQLPGDYGGAARAIGSFSVRKALTEGFTLAPIGYWQPMLCREDTPAESGGSAASPSTGRYGEKV